MDNVDRYHEKKVKALQDMSPIIQKGDIGTITAYLPEENIFAIWFGPRRWVTFEENEETFLKRIELAGE